MASITLLSIDVPIQVLWLGGVHWNQKLWRRSIEEFPEFLEPLVSELGRSERREGAALYVQGLLLPGERKSIEPTAERLGVDSQKLQQFVADSPWEEELVWRAIRREVVPALEPLSAWIVDETGWVKQGDKSVGVAHQYCGAVGKQANCQVSVEVVVSNGEIAAPVAGRLYLPQAWAEDATRREAVGVPPDITFQTKPAIAAELIRQVLADGVSPAPVLGDEVYGASSELRAQLRRSELEYMLNAGGDLLAWTKSVKTRFAKKYWDVADGQPEAMSLATLTKSIAPRLWHPVTWRAADETKRRTRIACLPVYLYSDLDRLTGEWPQTWLVVDWPEGDIEPYHLYVAWFKRAPSPTRCARLSRSRFHVEQCFQRKKTDLGFDHYEGRSWRGFHHHLVLTCVAYLFVLAVHLRSKKNFWCYVGTGAARDAAVVGAVNRQLPLLRDEI